MRPPDTDQQCDADLSMTRFTVLQWPTYWVNLALFIASAEKAAKASADKDASSPSLQKSIQLCPILPKAEGYEGPRS